MSFAAYIRAILAGCLIFFSLVVNSYAKDSPYLIGLFPYLEPPVLVKRNQPMVDYFSNATGEDFKIQAEWRYINTLENARQGIYDLAFVPEHFAASLIDDYGYKPIARVYAPGIKPVLFVNSKSGIHSIEDLMGSTLVTPDTLALVSMVGIHDIKLQGLEAYEDYEHVIKVSHDRVIMEVLKDPYKAGIAVSGIINSLDNKLKSKIRVIKAYADINAGFFIYREDSDLVDKYNIKELFRKFLVTDQGRDLVFKKGRVQVEMIDVYDSTAMDFYKPH